MYLHSLHSYVRLMYHYRNWILLLNKFSQVIKIEACTFSQPKQHDSLRNEGLEPYMYVLYSWYNILYFLLIRSCIFNAIGLMYLDVLRLFTYSVLKTNTNRWNANSMFLKTMNTINQFQTCIAKKKKVTIHVPYYGCKSHHDQKPDWGNDSEIATVTNSPIPWKNYNHRHWKSIQSPRPLLRFN